MFANLRDIFFVSALEWNRAKNFLSNISVRIHLVKECKYFTLMGFLVLENDGWYQWIVSFTVYLSWKVEAGNTIFAFVFCRK